MLAYLNLTPSVDGFHLIQSLLIVDASASLRVESLIVIIPATIPKNRLKKIPTVDGFGFWLNHHSCWLNPIKLLSPVFFWPFARVETAGEEPGGLETAATSHAYRCEQWRDGLGLNSP